MTADQRFETGDFVRVSYTARVVETGRVVDTTDPETAEAAAIADLSADGPVTVALGSDQLFDPVDEALRDTPVGETVTVTVPPEDGFGEPRAEARRTVDHEDLAVDADDLRPGDRVQHDGEQPFVEAVDGETVTLNFDHPLAGAEIEYEITPIERVGDTEDRLSGLLASYGLTDDVEATLDGDRLRIAVTPDAVDGWAERKRGLVADVRSALDVGRVDVVETYPATEGE